MKLTRTTTYNDETTLELPPQDAIEQVVAILEKHGAYLDRPDASAVHAVVGSGALNMNSAEVDVRVEPVGENRSRVIVNASAEEGLIKQRTAEKAVTRIIAEL